MTTLYSRQPRMRVPHHPFRVPDRQESEWRAQRRLLRIRYRLLMTACVLGCIAPFVWVLCR